MASCRCKWNRTIISMLLLLLASLYCGSASGALEKTNQLDNDINQDRTFSLGDDNTHIVTVTHPHHHTRGRGEFVPDPPRSVRAKLDDERGNHILPDLPSDTNDYYETGSYDEEEDEDDLPTHWGESFNKNETDQISEMELEEEAEDYAVFHLKRKAKVGKCCPFYQGLNSQGLCKNLTKAEQHFHRDVSWFPDKVFNITANNWTSPDQSDWDVTAPTQIRCPPNESAEVIYDTSMFVILTNGKLYLPHHSKDVAPLQFCVDLLIGRGRAVRSCFTRSELCKDAKNCLRKCCPEGAMVDETSGDCIFDPQTNKNKFPVNKWNVIHGSPTCKFGQYLTEINGFFNIGQDGSLITSSASNASFLNYCLDFFLDSSSGQKKSRSTGSTENFKSGNSNSLSSQKNQFHENDIKDDGDEGHLGKYKATPVPVLKAIMCFESYADEISKKRDRAGLITFPKEIGFICGIAFILSAICIALAGLISLRLPELRSLHGKCQLSHLATLFFLFVILSIVHLGAERLTLYTNFCTFLAVSLHICVLSAFLWLNLLCVNIYLTFRSLRPPLAARRDENRRLICLCLYAWGIPVAFCLFLFVLDSTPGRLEPMPRPEYGELSCLMSNRTAQFAYMFGPVGVLLLLNGMLFCLTAQQLLCGVWRLDNSDSISFRRKSMGIVVAKLGIVMGMGWILDVLSWGVGYQFKYIFYAADLFNALQGVFIFLVLIWRKRVLEVLRLRKPSLIKDDSHSHRPFLNKANSNSVNNTTAQDPSYTTTNGDPETSLVLMQES